ncbi:hypothetical protein ACTHUE_19905, partial [Neisseria sp. P0021.S005]|uniref:hypothetical protein n=1 Tax=Neisseria sp. P0021.S005 TaxID=3436820 RepID=UPI003F7DCEFA
MGGVFACDLGVGGGCAFFVGFGGFVFVCVFFGWGIVWVCGCCAVGGFLCFGVVGFCAFVVGWLLVVVVVLFGWVVFTVLVSLV